MPKQKCRTRHIVTGAILIPLCFLLISMITHQIPRPDLRDLAVNEQTGDIAIAYDADGKTYLKIYSPDGTPKDRHVFPKSGSVYHLYFDTDPVTPTSAVPSPMSTTTPTRLNYSSTGRKPSPFKAATARRS